MARYIDADALMAYISDWQMSEAPTELTDKEEKIFTHYDFGECKYDLLEGVYNTIKNFPTADVVERKEFILDGEKCSYHFAEINGYKNIVFTFNGAVTDITNIRIRLDKYDLAEVVHGVNRSENGFMCSVCGYSNFSSFLGFKPNYCPYCGAKMINEKEK